MLDEATLGDEIASRINRLGTISEAPEHLARIFLSPEHRIAADLILFWMKDIENSGRVCPVHEQMHV
jgi:allantoate deiminase